jgi:hypothetical protein
MSRAGGRKAGKSRSTTSLAQGDARLGQHSVTPCLVGRVTTGDFCGNVLFRSRHWPIPLFPPNSWGGQPGAAGMTAMKDSRLRNRRLTEWMPGRPASLMAVPNSPGWWPSDELNSQACLSKSGAWPAWLMLRRPDRAFRCPPRAYSGAGSVGLRLRLRGQNHRAAHHLELGRLPRWHLGRRRDRERSS